MIVKRPDTNVARAAAPRPWPAVLTGSAFLVCSAAVALAQQPSLDDLLDLTPPPSDAPAPPSDVPLDPEVARRLQGQGAADVLEQAIADMEEVSHRLGRDLDPSLTTQRQQEEILAKLDRVIEEAKKQQQQSSSGGGSSGQSQGQSQGQQSGSAQNQGQGQQQGSGQNQGQDGQQSQGEGQESSPGVRSPSDPRQGEATRPIEEQRAEWGNLPPRLRDQLLEGTREKFSPIYRDLTEQYYKRLAEEGR